MKHKTPFALGILVTLCLLSSPIASAKSIASSILDSLDWGDRFLVRQNAFVDYYYETPTPTIAPTHTPTPVPTPALPGVDKRPFGSLTIVANDSWLASGLHNQDIHLQVTYAFDRARSDWGANSENGLLVKPNLVFVAKTTNGYVNIQTQSSGYEVGTDPYMPKLMSDQGEIDVTIESLDVPQGIQMVEIRAYLMWSIMVVGEDTTQLPVDATESGYKGDYSYYGKNRWFYFQTTLQGLYTIHFQTLYLWDDSVFIFESGNLKDPVGLIHPSTDPHPQTLVLTLPAGKTFFISIPNSSDSNPGFNLGVYPPLAEPTFTPTQAQPTLTPTPPAPGIFNWQIMQ